LDFRLNLFRGDELEREKSDFEKKLKPQGAELAILKMKAFQNS
jgi:hypothetical protein